MTFEELSQQLDSLRKEFDSYKQNQQGQVINFVPKGVNWKLVSPQSISPGHKHNASDIIGGGSTPGGSNQNIQFNDGGTLNGTPAILFDKTTDFLTLDPQTTSYFSIVGKDAPNTPSSTDGVPLVISTGKGVSSGGKGGYLSIASGDGGTSSGAGGDININGGNAKAGNTFGGGVYLTGGNASGNKKGAPVELDGGTGGSTGDGGNIILRPGISSGSGERGNVNISIGTNSTTRNEGFLLIPTSAGAPTGTPSTPGSLTYDTSNNKLYIYNGGWKSVTLT